MFLDQFENIDPEIHGIRLPKFRLNEEDFSRLNIPRNLSSLELFRLLVNRGFEKRLKDGDFDASRLDDYKARLKHEMSVIEPTDFVDYMLMVWDVVNIAHFHKIATGPGRGSAASSLVLYCLNITDIDPVRNELYFERFLSEARVTPTIVDGIKYYSDAADVDLDIEDSKRGELISILHEKYNGYFCKISTLGTLQSRKNIKEVCKIVLGYPEQKSLEISALIPSLYGKVYSLKKAVEEVPEFKKFVEKNPKAYKIALKLSELPFAKGSHASAYIVSYEPLLECIPCELGEGEMVTSYDMDYAMKYNIKLDLLGLKAVGIINEVCQNLKLNPKDFKLDSENVFEHLKRVDFPYGLFQISGDCNLRVVNKVKPSNLDELAAVTALARPGALQFVDRYAEYTNNGSCSSVHPFFDDVLSSTAGLALYQEQTMKMCEKIGLSKADGELIRKVIGKKLTKKVEEWKSKIFDVVEKNGLDKEIAEVLWKILEDSANYSFNKSHSVSYGTLAAQTVYLKNKYPQQFFLACLRMASTRGDFLEQFNEIQRELPYFNIRLLPPQIGKSHLDFTLEGENIRFGLAEIKGVSDKSLSKLREFLASENSSDLKIFNAAKESKLSIGILCSLIQSGALGHNVYDRSRKVLEAQIWNILTPKEKLYCLKNEEKYKSNLIDMLKDYLNWVDSSGSKFTKESRLETIRKKSADYFKIFNLNHSNELFASYFYEKSLLGFSYSTSLKMIYGTNNPNIKSLAEIRDFTANKDSIETVAIVKETFFGVSKSGNRYLKIVLVDESAEFSAMLLGGKLKNYLENNPEPVVDDIVLVEGQRGDDIIWIEGLKIQNHKIYTKLSELNNINELQ